MRKYNSYSLDMLSKKAIEKLPEVLDEMGYSGRYQLSESYLQINSTWQVVSKVFHRAEELAHDEEGYLVKLKQVSFSEIWIPKTEAGSLKEAYQKALEHAENGYPINRDPEYAVGSAEDGGYRQEWELEYM